MIQLVLVVVFVGVLLYLVHAVIPMDPKIRTILSVAVILAVLLFVAEWFGVFNASAWGAWGHRHG
jgi:hypothetical protein